ncbi:hypothetical protein A1O7_01714 [Cladophialophora yegresii CBS 114405]|uniref:Major facilitator superfamily (MFS) profile domain-containing protein n=1 Tax=Cladophialophora yegresii CBS 114405 TaxID=1182544 RepID=W9WBS4_9EURO|nr:uncharacterized protein A1O7_01714 [Cladophialophora yegresii CBS 114405]EXJ65373.1 hypothetical protein A1O7_01714 [Cladophialophora yegresii CBS 114405]
MAERVERQLMSSTSPTSADVEKINTGHSLASNEEPVPALEPPVHKRGSDSPDTQVEDGIRFVYLDFDTHIPLDEFDTLESSIPPPILKKYESPLTWSSKHKTIILILCCWCTFTAAYSAGSYSIAANPQRAKWHLGEVAFNTGVTTWATGFAISPMVLAPFSEINGRRPVFIGSAILFLVGQIACATTPTFGGMLAARFLVGAGASTFATMVGGVVSDMYNAEDRNTPMALYSGSALAGTGIGPLLSGFIIGRANFRWVYYHQIISLSVMLVVVYFFFKETRGSVLLSRRAKVLNEYLEKLENSTPKSENAAVRLRYKVAADESRSSLARMLYLSLTIPFKLLTTEPVVFFFSLWVAFAWALLYMTFSVIPLVFMTRHNFNVEQCGAVFSAIAIGSILATLLSIYQEKLAKKRWPKLNSSPEGRLYFPCLEGALLPIGLFWFGWTTYSSIPWISPVLAIGCAQMGIFVIYLAVFNYLADVYHRYASSALAAQSFLRNIFAAVFPLFTNQMFTNLDYAPASSLLGGIAALLTIVPWVLLFKGEQIRARSKIARQIMGDNAS